MRKLLSIVVGLLLLSAVSIHAQTFEPDRYANLPQSQSLQGFPQLGFPSALVDLIVYIAFDDPASAAFWQDSYRGLLPRVQSGEIRLVFVPLTGQGDIPGGRGAARAAICAGDQGAYFQYQDMLFGALIAQGMEVYTGELFLQTAESLGLNAGQWTNCISGDGPDFILSDGESALANDAFFNGTPYVKVNESPSLTDLESLNFAIDVQLEQANADLAADMTTPTPDPEATDEAEPLFLDPVTGQSVPPPLSITLPSGWVSGQDVLVLQDVDAIRNIPFSVYSGPVTGGVGTIILLWGFPNLAVVSPTVNLEDVESVLDLYTDGTRLLRLAIVEVGCNVGTDLRRTYSIGGLQAVGTQFSAVECPELGDTRGWFAGLRQYDLNFMFYAFAEPIDAMDDGAEADLQAILDTIQFTLPETD